MFCSFKYYLENSNLGEEACNFPGDPMLGSKEVLQGGRSKSWETAVRKRKMPAPERGKKLP